MQVIPASQRSNAGDRGHLKPMRLLPFAAASGMSLLTLGCRQVELCRS